MKNENFAAGTPKISVVVPVYKVEKFLAECVESLLKQSFRDFEILLVDDGSPDNSGKICDEFAAKDSRIRVFHKENGGVTSARKFGVERSRAEWICFVDSDDIVPEGALEALFAGTTKFGDDVDLVEGKNIRFKKTASGTRKILKGWGDLKYIENRLNKGAVLVDGFEFGKEVASEKHFFGAPPWKKIIRKSLFSETAALDIPRWLFHGEDSLMNLRLSKKIRRAVHIPEIVYEYRQNLCGVSGLPENKAKYREAKFVVAKWDLTKNSFSEMDEKWQEVWKIFVASTYFASRKIPLRSVEIRPYLEALREQRNMIRRLIDRVFISTASFPWTLVPEKVFLSGISLYHRARVSFSAFLKKLLKIT